MQVIPAELRRFLEANIESIDQLEILRILGEDPSREWSADELAQEVQSTPEAVATHLLALQGRGLIQRFERDGKPHGRYGPTTPELETLLGRLLALYRERPVTMIKLVYARAAGTLRTLADAFRLRRDE